MESMVSIKDISGNILQPVLLTENCEHIEELMQSDYVTFSWESDQPDTLPVGAYIEYKGEKYSLLEPYSPIQNDELKFTYQPQFQSVIMSWVKIPFFMYNYSADNEITSREPDWELTDNPANFMSVICNGIKNETGETWTYSVDASLPASATLVFQSVDIFSALNSIANAFETEWWADKANKVLHLSKAEHGTPVVLEVGVNVNTPSVTNSKEGYYTRFYAFGSTRNIVQDYRGANVNNLVNKRLTLDPVKYPNGYKDIRPGLQQGEIFPKILIFDDVYPSSNLAISDVRVRLMWKIDESTGEKVQIGTNDDGNPIYDQYAIWYFRIPGFTLNNSFYGKDNPDGMRISGKELSAHFETGALQGREFELIYHDKSETVSSADGTSIVLSAGDYEIKFKEEGTYIIPAITALIPSDGDHVILFNIRMPHEYVNAAYTELEAAMDKEIARLSSDLNNYQFSSNPIAFYENNPGLSLGRKVTYVNGNYSYSTRVIRLATKLDYDFQQDITIGNDKIKGNTQEIKEEVASANKDLNLLTVINDMTSSLQQSYQRTQKMMMDGFANIKNMWQFDPETPDTIYSKYNVWSTGFLSAKGLNPGDGGSGTGGSSGASFLYELADVHPNEDGTGVLGASAGKVLTYGSDGKWYAADAAGGLDVSAMWDALSAADSSKKIDASHLPDLGGKYVTLDTFQTITSGKAFSSYVHFRTGTRGLSIYSDLRGNAGAIEITGENGLWAAHSLEFENSGNIICYHRFTSKGGIYAYGRVFGSGDDEGIVVNRAENRYAALTLGDATGLHSTFYLFPDNRAIWRYNDGTTNFDIEHPYKSGTVALVSDLSDYVRKSGDKMTGALNFANNTPNLAGDDVYIGDLNRAGHLGVKGANGETGISFLSHGSEWSSNARHYSISWNGKNMRASSNALFNNLNADMLDGYHRENLFNNHIEVMNTWGKTVTINIEGDSNTYYPVVISCIHEKEWLHHISVWKSLGSRTASYPGNHSNGTSSLWVMYEGRNNEWDGNCGFYRTVYWNYGYAALVAKAEATGGSDGRLVVWLRGGGTEYKISADYKVYVNIYYEEHDISRFSDHPKYVAPTTEIGNKGVVNTQPMFGSLRGSLWGQWYDAVDGVNGKLTVRHSGLYGLELRSTDSAESSIDYRTLNGDRFVAGAYPHRFFIWKEGFGEIISFLNNGNVGIGNTNPYYTLDVNGSVRCTDWIRNRGNNGWYNESYDGGIYMEDSQFVKVYHTPFFRCDMFSAGINGYSDNAYSVAYNAAAPNNDNYCCYSFIRSAMKAFGMGFNTDNEIWLGTANTNRKASSQWIHINDRGVWTDGHLSCKGNNTSDARLKKDINDFNATSILRLLRPVSFKWNDIARRNSKVFDTDGVQYGLIAQETKAVAPWAVVDNMFNDGYMGVRYEKFIPLLMKAEIETMDEVADLKRRLTDVERENEILKKKLKMLEAA